MGETCFHVQGTVDRNIWPTSITWAGGRYRVTFVSTARAEDKLFDSADNQYAGPNDAPHETQRLDRIKVESDDGGGWQLVHQYNLDYDYSLRPDTMDCSSACVPMNEQYHRLTLKNITRMANDGTTALPTTSFGYGAFSFINSNGSKWFGGDWNRLTTVNNGQGGTITFTYENVGEQANNSLMNNYRRIKTKTLGDGQGNSYTWTYSYGTPNVNSLGTTRGPQALEWSYGNYGTQPYPNSAALYYNAFVNPSYNQQSWLVHKPMKEFRCRGRHALVRRRQQLEYQPARQRQRRTHHHHRLRWYIPRLPNPNHQRAWAG